MNENLEQEKTANIINSINAIKISNFGNDITSQNTQKDINMNNEKNQNNNNEIGNDNNTIDNTNITVSNENKTQNQSIDSNKKDSSEIRNKKKEQKGMKDLAFKFPIEKSLSRVEIPFSFQQNLNSENGNNRFHSYITIKDTPKLYIDISDDNNKDDFLITGNIESLKTINNKLEQKLQSIDNNIMKYKNENDMIGKEIEKINREILINNNNITHYKAEIEQINLDNSKVINEMSQKINEKNKIFENLQKNFENIEKEIKMIDNEEKKNEILYKINEQITTIQKNNYNNLKYYKNKFFTNINMPDDYISLILQKDVIDFMNLVEYKISIIKPKVNELINLIQNSVEKSLGKEYEVKLYGSHATGLCLPWSDIDVVLCKKNTNQNDNLYCNKYMPLHDLFTYLQKNNDFKSINYIGATSVPLIKIKTKENIDIKNVDISLQDNTHYGIKCEPLRRRLHLLAVQIRPEDSGALALASVRQLRFRLRFRGKRPLLRYGRGLRLRAAARADGDEQHHGRQDERREQQTPRRVFRIVHVLSSFDRRRSKDNSTGHANGMLPASKRHQRYTTPRSLKTSTPSSGIR